MRTFRIFLSLLLAAAGTLVFLSAGKTKECPCKLRGFINYEDTSSVKVLAKPNGKVTGLLKGGEEPILLRVKASKRGWLQLDSISGEPEGNVLGGWVPGNVVGIYTRNYDGGSLALYKGPGADTGEAGMLWGMQEVSVEGCCNGWALVKGKTREGKALKGWLSPEMQCAKPDGACN